MILKEIRDYIKEEKRAYQGETKTGNIGSTNVLNNLLINVYGHL